MPSIPWSKRTPDPNPTAEKLFNEGTGYLNNKKYVLAIDTFKQLQSEFPFAPELIQAELKLGEAYYLNKDYPEAISTFKEFQAMHPTNENIPFVTYHLGLAHFDQFTNVDRDQKVTGIAKDYFETLIKNYPASPYAAQAKEKLVLCIAHLAEHEFNIASFYVREQNYPAARERLEGILRLYPQSPLAAKSLYSLGETYRLQKNTVKAALAYQALIQHFPESPLVKQAKTQLGQLDHEKQDPLALLLMRDHRPAFAPTQIASNGQPQSASPGVKESKTETPDLKTLNMVAKTEVVYEEPGSDKGFFRRVADTLNPFSSSSSSPPDSSAGASKANGVAKPGAAKEQPTGFFASLWPFGGKSNNDANTKTAAAGDSGLVQKIDESLKQKGIDPESKDTATKAPAEDLSKIASKPAPPVDASVLLGNIDAKLEKDGKQIGELPPSPEPDRALIVPVTNKQEVATVKPQPPSKTEANGLITNIDEKLKAKGIDPSSAPTSSAGGLTTAYKPVFEASTTSSPGQGKVELEPRMSMDKGPLFLESGQVRVEDLDKVETDKEKIQKTTEPSKELPKAVVTGPAEKPQVKTAEAKPAEKKATGEPDGENKGVFDQIIQDVGRVQTLLNPFSW